MHDCSQWSSSVIPSSSWSPPPCRSQRGRGSLLDSDTDMLIDYYDAITDEHNASDDDAEDEDIPEATSDCPNIEGEEGEEEPELPARGGRGAVYQTLHLDRTQGNMASKVTVHSIHSTLLKVDACTCTGTGCLYTKQIHFTE